MNESRPLLAMDTECYVNYWSIGFKGTDGRVKVFELYDGCELDKKAIASIFRQYTVISFNGIKYDMPMIMYAMSGATNGELKRASDELIQFGTPHWVFMDRLGLSIPDFVDHVDLMQVSPGAPTMPSLKIYAGRLHSRKMQELPIAIDEHIGPAERQVIKAYHENDLDVTLELLRELKPQIDLRALMSAEYGVDVRSKSDAQVAEAVIRVEIEKALGHRVYPPDSVEPTFRYQVQSWCKFETVAMRAALGVITGATFKVDINGAVRAQEGVQKLSVRIGASNYQMGIGGLHSQEARISHYSSEKFVLLDRDVTSYYPQSMLLQAMYPKHLGPVFLAVYKRIYDRRVAAKKAGKKNEAESLKITLNGCFGKLGSPYSIFYSPNLLIQVTLSGQLALLMLIERLELAGIQVISANTDGIISNVPRDRRDEFNAVVATWEADTGFTTEETEYLSIHSQSVNAYIAVKRDKTVKRKGAFSQAGPGLDGAAGLKKNPQLEICVDAVIEYLTNGTPIEDTIEWSVDPRKFVAVRRVTGGAEKDGETLGKALRWYHATGVSGGLHRVDSGNSVPMTIGAKLMMELPVDLPGDVDYGYYIREAYAILQDVGATVVDPVLRGRTGRVMARLPDAKNIHTIDLPAGIALCGKARDSIRDTWVEVAAIPEGHRACGKCKRVLEWRKANSGRL